MRSFVNLISMAAVIVAAFFVSGCTSAVISGQCDSSYAGKVICVKMYDISSFADKTVDSVKIASDGKWKSSIKVDKTSPEFVYLFIDSTKMASLVVKTGDKINVSFASDGPFPLVVGSEESILYTQVEKDYAKAMSKLELLSARLAASGNPTTTSQVRQEITQAYLQFYRTSVRFVVSNPHSFVTIPVLYQYFGQTPVFASASDGLHFLKVADSLAVDYPDSRYVKELRQEGKRRMEILKRDSKISEAEAVICPDLSLNDIEGKTVGLHSSMSKLTVLYFWMASDARMNRYNVDILKPFYQKMHDKGVEIYAVSLDTDKALWASCVKGQDLPWINVNDILGPESPTISLYNVTGVPCLFFITEDDIKRLDAIDESSLEKIALVMLDAADAANAGNEADGGR